MIYFLSKPVRKKDEANEITRGIFFLKKIKNKKNKEVVKSQNSRLSKPPLNK